jgi:predicted small integral membrane protein
MQATLVEISLSLVKLVVMGGLAFWMALAVINNAIGFRGAVAAIGHLMNMEPLRQPPTADSPLLARAIGTTGWHRFVMALTLLFEIGCGLLLWCATAMIVASIWGTADREQALTAVNLSLAALIALLFFFMLGGTWFVYYVKQEGLQISHVTMTGLAIGAAILCNAV